MICNCGVESKDPLSKLLSYNTSIHSTPPGQIEVEHREETELEKNTKMIKEDLLKLNTLLSKNGQLSQALEQENALIETDFLHRLKAWPCCLMH